MSHQVIDAETEPQRLQIAVEKTAAQSKNEAIASLTMKAYDQASLLKLTDEEAKRLQADFPDEAFRPGAGGKDNLIYIEHAFLRDRLNEVLGLGQWVIVPRNRWTEEFPKGVRVYVEAMLMVRGCFVSESVGSMEYWTTNNAQDYGDAVEGAKTNALRRCCKEFGVGLQAWKKGFCEEWWKRRGTQPAQSGETEQPKQISGPKPFCPKCGSNSSVILGKAEFGGGFVCWKKSKPPGCGNQWQESPEKKESNQDLKAIGMKILDVAKKDGMAGLQAAWKTLSNEIRAACKPEMERLKKEAEDSTPAA